MIWRLEFAASASRLGPAYSAIDMPTDAPSPVDLTPNLSASGEGAVAEYARRHETYEAAASRLKQLLRQLCSDHGVRVHKIEARAKDVKSFAEKVNRVGKKYTDPLGQMPDLAGLRVIVHTLVDIDLVANVIDAHFHVLETEDKRATLKPDQFGYLSLHKVFRLKPRHAALFEWSAFAGLRFEVQIRTVLQHAWAVTSHQVQYKTKREPPEVQRRKLARISGLLEMADEQLQEVCSVGGGAAGTAARTSWEWAPPSESQAGTLWDTALSADQRHVLGPMGSPLCQRIIAAARHAGVPPAEEQIDSLKRLAGLWEAIEHRLHFNPQDLLRRIDGHSEGVFRRLDAELRRTYDVSVWRANDAQLLVAATIISLGEPKLHMYVLRHWAKGYLKALRAVMYRAD